MRVAIAGASGFVGRRLAPALADQGHEVVVLGRRASALPSGAGIEARALDVSDRATTTEALRGAEVAYYLVHSMGGGPGYAERDRALAAAFADAAEAAGVHRIVYLGALGSGRLSEHLSSRQEVGDVLRSSGLEVVELRAAVVLGAGSISFEMLRYLVERLPAMVCPRWVGTRIQPVALRDVISYLVRSVSVAPGVYGIGVAERTSYREMMDLYAGARGLRRRVIVDVPLLTLRLSGYWVDLVTPVDRKVSRALIESLAHEVLVEDLDATIDAFGFKPMSLEDAMRAALDDQVVAVSRGLLEMRSGLADGVHSIRVRQRLGAGDAARARADLASIGGDLRWYGLAVAWRARLLLGAILGERTAVAAPPVLQEGANVDWWIVDEASAGTLVLRTEAWRPGEAWLGFRVAADGGSIDQVAALRPRGVGGLAYWRLLLPVHRAVFAAMARHRARRARR